MASEDSSAPGWTPGGVARPAVVEELDSPDEPDKWGPLRDFVMDRLPESVRGARLDPGVRGALALACVALVAALWRCFWPGPERRRRWRGNRLRR